MKRGNETREQLITHYRLYPKLQIRDLFKFLYQSAFGCEHLVSDSKFITDYIVQEYKNVSKSEKPKSDELDGEYCRVHLSYLNSGISVETLGKLFVLSAKKEENGIEALKQKLEVARQLVCENILPFSVDEFENAVKVWGAEGFTAVRHTETFRESYHPSYRVIAKKYVPFLPFFAEIDKLLSHKSAKIAIEGGSACGKTTLSSMLADIYDCTLFHMDDFFLRPEQRTAERYTQPGGNVDRERFLSEVLLPLYEGRTVKYRKFDCSKMTLGETVEEYPRGLTVIEGAYSMHPELSEYYDFSLFLDITPELQKKRILHRNSPQFAKNFFERWIPLENEYFEKMNVKERCDLVIKIS